MPDRSATTLDRMDEIVPPGTDLGRLDMAEDPPAIDKGRPAPPDLDERSAA